MTTSIETTSRPAGSGSPRRSRATGIRMTIDLPILGRISRLKIEEMLAGSTGETDPVPMAEQGAVTLFGDGNGMWLYDSDTSTIVQWSADGKWEKCRSWRTALDRDMASHNLRPADVRRIRECARY